MDIPFVIFIPAFSIAVGILLGGAFRPFLEKTVSCDVEHSLHQLEEGRQTG